MFNKVVYALGFAALLYLAEEIGIAKGVNYERKIIRSIAEKHPGKPLDQILDEFEEARKSFDTYKEYIHHTDDDSVC